MRKLYYAIWVILSACAGSGGRNADVQRPVAPVKGSVAGKSTMRAARPQPPKKVVPPKTPAVTAQKPVSKAPAAKPARKLTKEEEQLSSIAMDFAMTEDATDLHALLATTLPALAKEAKKLGMYRWGTAKAIKIEKDHLMGVLVQVSCMMKNRLPKKCRDDRDEDPPASC